MRLAAHGARHRAGAQAGAYFREQGIQFDHVYSSTSERCCDTTELIVPGVPYEHVKGLKEWNFGKFEGITEDLNPEHPFGDFYVQFGGEDEMEFRDRLVRTVTELMRRPEHESVLMVSHGAAIAQFPRAFGVDLREVTGKRVGNCGMAVYEFNGDSSFTLLVWCFPTNNGVFAWVFAMPCLPQTVEHDAGVFGGAEFGAAERREARGGQGTLQERAAVRVVPGEEASEERVEHVFTAMWLANSVMRFCRFSLTLTSRYTSRPGLSCPPRGVPTKTGGDPASLSDRRDRGEIGP